MFIIDKLSRTPIYEQLIAQFEYGLLSGEIAPDGKLPSVRELSQQLTINPNTLQRAFSEIERRGLCFSVPGNGRYIAKDALESLKRAASDRLSAFSALAESLAAGGVPKSALLDAIEAVYASQKEKEAEQ
jgi:GntR family transcriptional regulator